MRVKSSAIPLFGLIGALALVIVLIWSGGIVPAQSIYSTGAPLPMEGGGRAPAGPANSESDPLASADDERLLDSPAPAPATTTTVTTASGLVINASFDISITNNANAAAIEATINQAIAAYQS